MTKYLSYFLMNKNMAKKSYASIRRSAEVQSIVFREMSLSSTFLISFRSLRYDDNTIIINVVVVFFVFLWFPLLQKRFRADCFWGFPNKLEFSEFKYLSAAQMVSKLTKETKVQMVILQTNLKVVFFRTVLIPRAGIFAWGFVFAAII